MGNYYNYTCAMNRVALLFFCFFVFAFTTLLISCSDSESEKEVNGSHINEKYRFAYDAIERGPDYEYFKYSVTDWKSIVTMHPFDTPGTPSLGWKIMGPFMSLYHLYRLTDDEAILKLLGDMTEEIIKCRDDNRNIVSWNGVVYPLWASGRRSNNAYYEIKNVKDKTCAIIDFHGSGFDEDYISVIPANNNHFDLVINSKAKEYRVVNTSLSTLEDDIQNVDWSVYVSPLPNNKVLSARVIGDVDTAVRMDINSLLSSYYVPNLVNNAIIINLLINYYNSINGKNSLVAQRYYSLITESIGALLDLYMHSVDEYTCCFNSPKNSPCYYGGGAALPFNEQFYFVEALARWYKVTKDVQFYSCLSGWRGYFLSNLIPYKNGYVWKYWNDPSETVTWLETENYGSIDIPALMITKYSTDIFSDADIQKVTSCLIENLVIVENERVQTASDFSFRRYLDKLPNTAYLTLKDYWPELPIVFLNYFDPGLCNWMEHVNYLFYLECDLAQY